MRDALIVNLSDLATKRQLMAEIGRLSGPHEILIRKIRLTRSLNANKYYFAAVVQPFCEWLREAYGDPAIDKEQAHEMLKVKILGMSKKEVDGETLHLIPRSKTLTDEEFSDYIERASAWLAEFAGIVVLPPDMFVEKK